MVSGELPPTPLDVHQCYGASLIGVGVYLQKGHGDLAVADKDCAACKILEFGSVDR